MTGEETAAAYKLAGLIGLNTTWREMNDAADSVVFHTEIHCRQMVTKDLLTQGELEGIGREMKRQTLRRLFQELTSDL